MAMTPSDEHMRDGDHHDLYAQAEAYDIAFDFRDLDVECDALDDICLKYRGGKPASFVDVACGPGYHCIHYATRGLRTYGVDINPAMIEYATQKAIDSGAEVDFIEADMRDFSLPQPVDLAFCGIASIHYLLTAEAIIGHLRTVARNLTPGGLYLFEANHPRDTFGVGKSTHNDWEARRGDTIVRSRWGLDDISFDPITQIAHSKVKIEIERDGQIDKLEFTNIDRTLTHQELKLILTQSGVFEAVDWLGALDPDKPFDNSKQSWRMIPVLRRV
jgi:SAM-dependent methyltransferase